MEETRLRAIVVVNDVHEVSVMVKILGKLGLATTVRNDPNEALDECRRTPPDLAIVEKTMVSMTGPRFLDELLKVSWTTSTILIADEDEKALHQETEGLGILGSIRTVNDVEGLERLIAKFLAMLPPAPRTGS